MAFGRNSMKSHRLIQVAVKALTEKITNGMGKGAER
jgi:hypothetical protein